MSSDCESMDSVDKFVIPVELRNNITNNEDYRDTDFSNLNSGTDCKVIGTKNFPKNLNKKSRYCQVCLFELRNDVIGGVVACTAHAVRLCSKIHKPRQLDKRYQLYKTDNTLVTDFSWTCETTDSCWNKFHSFYLPKGLFTTKKLHISENSPIQWSRCVVGNELYQARYRALGIVPPDGKIKAKLNKKFHMRRVECNETNNSESTVSDYSSN